MKAFQSQVFEQFLRGVSLKECYAAVGSIGNTWLDVLGMYAVSHFLLTLPLSYPYSPSVRFTLFSFLPFFLPSSLLPSSFLLSPFLHHFHSILPLLLPLYPFLLPFLPFLIFPSTYPPSLHPPFPFTSPPLFPSHLISPFPRHPFLHHHRDPRHGNG